MKTALRLLLAPYRFSVDRLFRMGEVGWAHWFDSPSLYPGGNHLYLYKDSDGTTPVTAVGDTIGLSLDRAYGGARGPELLSNRSFENGSAGWVVTAPGVNTVTISGGAARFQTTGSADTAILVQAAAFGANKVFHVEFDVLPGSSGQLKVLPIGGASGEILFSCTPGRKRFCSPVTFGTSFTISRVVGQAADAYLTNFSCREIPGTHLIQATGTAKPTLSARVNLLLATETLTNGAWSAIGTAPTITENAGTAPNGTLGADRVQLAAADSRWRQSAALLAGASYVEGVWVKSNTGGSQTFRLFGADASANSANLTATTTWQWFSFPFTNSGSTAAYAHGIRTDSSNTAADLLVWGFDLRTADDAAKNIPAYQRVGATAADHDTDGFPHGQYPDGTDDNQTTTTGGGGTTGFFYCGAITVSGGAGTARTIWSDTGTNTGYRVRINSSNKLELAAGNGTAYTTVQSNETITAPGTYLLSAWDDGGVLAVQVNNFAPATTTRPTVSAGTAAITVYKDNGAASSYFNGRDYGSVYRQSYIGESQHARLKRWLADRARITL